MLYTAKEIKRILGITPGQLFHWGRTWGLIEPEVKAKGRQGKNKYSLENLVQLAVIKELVNSGIELSFIEQLIESTNIFDLLRQRRSFIVLHKSANRVGVYTVHEFYNLEREQSPKTYLVINVLKIIKEIEEKTGERFWRKGG